MPAVFHRLFSWPRYQRGRPFPRRHQWTVCFDRGLKARVVGLILTWDRETCTASISGKKAVLPCWMHSFLNYATHHNIANDASCSLPHSQTLRGRPDLTAPGPGHASTHLPTSDGSCHTHSSPEHVAPGDLHQIFACFHLIGGFTHLTPEAKKGANPQMPSPKFYPLAPNLCIGRTFDDLCSKSNTHSAQTDLCVKGKGPLQTFERFFSRKGV